MAEDELELDTLGDRKSALFVILSDTDEHLQFCGGASCTPSFSTFCATRRTTVYGGRLPVHVRCLLDEFANIGQIPEAWKS